MVNKPIKLQDNIYLYSGDVIIINNSSPLLVEIDNADKQTIRLRSIKDDKYFKKNFFNKLLSFSTNFENALIFTIRQNESNEISLQTDGDKCLKSKDKKFSLSPKERLLVIRKQKDIENIANFEEIIEDIELYKDKKINEEELLIACKSYDNKTSNSLEYNFGFTEMVQEGHNFTQSKDFTFGALVNLKLPFSSVAGMGISGQFQAKYGTSTAITKTETKIIQESLKVNCSPWKKTRVKLLAKKVKLLTPCTANVKRTIGGRVYDYMVDGEYSCDNYFESRCLAEEITTRNILIVGWTGSGKSTLAKVLSKSDEFEESSQSVSGTKFSKSSKEFEWKENYYCVIDNIGFGDTKVSERDVLIRIGEAINSAYQGLSHVLFVFDKKLSDKEKENFQKLAALKITNSYITLIRSNFENFGNIKECKKDRELLEKESLEISQLLNNCRELLHIDNDDKDSRDKSRVKILNHLHNSCSSVFKPKEWDDITSLIEDYFEKRKGLENEKNQANKEVIEQKIDNLETDTAEKVKEKAKGEGISEFVEVIEVTNK
jgi:energy-coupling factor transporter ATP-binding protein EcfA2